MVKHSLAAFLSLVVSGVLLAAAPPAKDNPEPANQVIDAKFGKTLPAQIDVVAYKVFMFDNTAAKVTVNPTDGKGPLAEAVPSGCGLSKSFRPTRQGEGEVVIEHKNGSVDKVKVKVHPLAISYTLKKGKAPKQIELLKGQRATFISKKIVHVEFKTTDKQKGDVIGPDKLLKGAHVRLAPGWVSFQAFESERAGSGEFILTWYDKDGKKVGTDTISVTVK